MSRPLLHILALSATLLSLLSAEAQYGATGAVETPVAASDGAAPWQAEPMRVRLPQEAWHNDASLLPPPPGWVAAEFASLGNTMGSSPESEPLQPGDELTLETGRLASHKSGFFQKLAFNGAWLNRGGQEDLGLVEAHTFLTVAVPLPSRDFPLLITPGFGVVWLDGPRQPDLPPQLYDAYLDFMWLPKLTDRWLGILSVTPGIYSDLDSMQDDAFRVKGKALMRYDLIPQKLQALLGVLYLNRNDVNWLPACGLIWDPHEDVHLELVFPRPQLAYRFTAGGLFEEWIYLAGEFGGDTWSYRRGVYQFDMLTYVDWRVYLGVERRREGGAAQRVEVGYVFGREIEFDSGIPDSSFDDTFMIRAGLDF